MELDLSLGTRPADEPLKKALARGGGGGRPSTSLKLGFCSLEDERSPAELCRVGEVEERRGSVDPPARLNLLLPILHLPGFSREMHDRSLEVSARELEVNSSGGDLRCAAAMAESSRFSDDEENGGARKKLRLSKEQSAFLEENFKEHSTLKPKQKSALAKQLNLRPRQVEVWFQNRRARTKLKQTEVDCEYMRRCCEALAEENRRLQKELSELRALKSTHHFYTQLPATTLSMCAACEAGGAAAGEPTVQASRVPSPASLPRFTYMP
ncbi:homeobox-leucine zipper protein HOX11-like [Phalaenopsis equestris]|uniref:homeobox-leucine zipper protein HOX11-like n=1 Tax=Phalaenopsis equestris TaxID=78828 RepID=UPI0009E1A750|nr:homeobox-leucine zipper protein HOX11-like [Phalaenopsis equestris]